MASTKNYNEQGNIFPLAILILLLIYLPFLGYVHLFDWDEINFAECAREMVISKNYLSVQIDFKPFFEKPPLFFWFQSFFYHLFGTNEFSARLPNVVIAILLSIYFLHYSLKKYNLKFGIIWCTIYHCSILPFVYNKSGIIDPVYNAFCFVGFFNILEGMSSKKYKYGIYAGILLGLATLTKGPVAPGLVILSALVFFLFKYRFELSTHLKFWYRYSILISLSLLFIVGIWTGVETSRHGTVFILEFFKYQIRLLTTSDAGHQQAFYYHIILVLIGCSPSSYLALLSLTIKSKKEININTNSDMIFGCWILIVIVLIIFTLVQTKIAHYSSMAYIPISFIAATFLTYGSVDKKYIYIFKWHLIFLITLIVTFILAMIYKDQLILVFKDEFVKQSLTELTTVGFNWGQIIGLIICGVGFIILLSKFQKMYHQLVILALGHVLFMYLILILILPKAEEISQKSL
ncbi:MAG: glycosyltransferase family 39 protein, partial [Saprospiraceae bacterium]